MVSVLHIWMSFFFANQDLERFVFFDVIHAGETKKPAQVSMTFSRKPSFKVILLMEEIPHPCKW